MNALTNGHFSMEPLESRRLLAAAPFSIGGSPSVHSQDFRTTTFATGLNFPDGMTKLPDGSLLVATNIPGAGGYFGASTGELVRLVDANHDGVADGPGIVLATGLPRLITDVRIAGKLVIVTSSGSVSHGVQPSIHIFSMGKKASSPLTPLSTLTFNFPSNWEHASYALETRPTPGKAGSYDVFFNVGSQDDHDTTPTEMLIGITSSDGAFSGQMHSQPCFSKAPGSINKAEIPLPKPFPKDWFTRWHPELGQGIGRTDRLSQIIHPGGG